MWMNVADRTKSINLELLEEMFQIEEKEKVINAGKWMPRPYYAGEIWKRSFTSTVRPTVHTNPSLKRSSNWTNLKLPAFRFIVDGSKTVTSR